MRSFAAMSVAILALVLMAGTRSVAVQDAITITRDEAVNEFPRGVTFEVEFRAPSPPSEVRLRYELAPDGTGASAVADCNGTTTITCSHTLVSGNGIFVIPGANITYHWEIEDEAGSRIATEDVVYVHEDTRFTFEPLTSGNVTVYYYGGRTAQAEAVLEASVDGMSQMSALMQAQVGFPVKVYLYETAEEMQPAIAPTGGRGVTTLGEVVYSDTAMVAADTAPLDIARHEVAHIVTREASRGPFGVPDWMNEGISVFAQNQPLDSQTAALEAAIRSDTVLTMAQLNSPASGGVAGTVSLYYAQAGDMVRYLVETYGEEQFATLVRTFKEGSTDDDAFDSVYGFDSLGLENEWRGSHGLEPRSASATPTPRATEEARAPATVPAGDNGAGTSNTDGDSEMPVVTIAIIVALAALALAALGGAALIVLNRRR